MDNSRDLVNSTRNVSPTMILPLLSWDGNHFKIELALWSLFGAESVGDNQLI